MLNRSKFIKLGLGAVAAGGLFWLGIAYAQSHMGGQMHGDHATMMQQHHGADGTGHDEATMPGLRGINASPE